MLVAVEVGVALTRPPRADRISECVVEARDECEAELIACQMVQRADVVMPVYSRVLDVLEI